MSAVLATPAIRRLRSTHPTDPFQSFRSMKADVFLATQAAVACYLLAILGNEVYTRPYASSILRDFDASPINSRIATG
jgi:hypothetical protein